MGFKEKDKPVIKQGQNPQGSTDNRQTQHRHFRGQSMLRRPEADDPTGKYAEHIRRQADAKDQARILRKIQ
jgi:23S rRNA maturation mini-RNase III